MSCNPRGGTCTGTGFTKTQQLRQAKSAALVKELEKKREAALRQQQDPFVRRKRISTYEPKKVDFSKPAMTKTMMARMKHAEKFKQEYESKKEIVTGRQPKRTTAPIGGDARVGREKIPSKETRHTRAITPTTTAKRALPRKEVEAGPSYLPPSKRDARSLKVPDQSIARKTTELARMMNADIVQAEPIGEGPISNIVIPPGIVSDERTTIVSIPQPTTDAEAKITSQVANRSIQVISETLDEQDAIETATVQNKLTELQQARREFVIAVANVGGNAVGIEETAHPTLPPKSYLPHSPLRTPPRRYYKIGALEEPMYGRDHPDILAAREHIQKTLADIEARKAAKRMEEEFERIAAKEESDDLHLDIPFEEELYQERDISWEEDEETGMAMPRPSRVKAYTEHIPKQQVQYKYEPFDPEQLERFLNLERYPPCPQCGPPEGREHLHPDLWDLDDPWYRPPPMPDDPDLIQFDTLDN